MNRRFIGWREIALPGLGLMTVMTGASLAPALPQMAKHFGNEPNAPFLVKFSLTLPPLSFPALRRSRAIPKASFGRGGYGLFLLSLLFLLSPLRKS